MEFSKWDLLIAVLFLNTFQLLVSAHRFSSKSKKKHDLRRSFSANKEGESQDQNSKIDVPNSQIYDSTLDVTRAQLHPLDPLTEVEINATIAVLKNFRRGYWNFNYIALKEPEKSILLPYFLKNTNPPPLSISRKAFAIILDKFSNQAYEVIVNLDKRKVENWVRLPMGIQPLLTQEELDEAEEIVRDNRVVQDRSQKLGWTNMSLVYADPWGYRDYENKYKDSDRFIQMYIYGRNFEGDNEYAHPFNFVVVVDIHGKRVVAVEDLPTKNEDTHGNNTEAITVPRETSNYDPDLRSKEVSASAREELRPVHISQPNGTNFFVSGNEINWQNFKMRIGFNGREGLVIYNLNYNDGGNVRPLFYRMSLAEMFTTYGDPRPPFNRKLAFHEGEYGIGFGVNELQAQLDCIGEVKYFDVVLHNAKGEIKSFSKAVCLREEDAGILWKHTDPKTGKSALVRSRRLALTFIATLGNYDYIYTWNFYQDGTIEFNVKVTGILSTNLLAENGTLAGHGSIVFPRISAQFHQHFFSLRLDAEIDGNKNSVQVSDIVPLSSPTGSIENPYGKGFTLNTTLLRTAGAAKSRVSPKNGRTWEISNPSVINPYTKQPVAWKLVPWPSPPMHVQKDSPIYPQVEWMEYNTWVTPYHENQMFPGGYYLNNSGLPEWIRKDENVSIENEDIVLWHNFGITHIPTTEDFPVMPADTCGVYIKPRNFFKENPALDIRPVTNLLRSEL